MVDWVTIIASVGISVVGSVMVTEYRLRREQSVEQSAELEDWYNESASLAAEVRRNWQRLFDTADRPSMNLSELQSKMSLLEGQISRHASKGEQLDADDEVIQALDRLAEQCRRPDERPVHSDSLDVFQEFREDILDAVESVESSLENK